MIVFKYQYFITKKTELKDYIFSEGLEQTIETFNIEDDAVNII